MLRINKEYPCGTLNYNKAADRKIDYIVIHYTGGVGSALANARYYMTANAKASTHFFVGHKSEGAQIYQSVDPKDKAWHCGGAGAYYHPSCRNANSIGIEVCCHNDTADKTAQSGGWYFDTETVDALAQLVRELMAEYHISADCVLRHYDVTHKLCPAMWVHNEAGWTSFKERLADTLCDTVCDKWGFNKEWWTEAFKKREPVPFDIVKALFNRIK